MREGVYVVSLEADGIKGLIIGTLCDGHMTGCDRTHLITGTYKQNGNRLSGTFAFKRHSRRPDIREIANLDDFEVRFNGIGGDGFGEIQSGVPGKPGLQVKAKFRWLCET